MAGRAGTTGSAGVETAGGAELRRVRRERVFDAMDRAGLDALVLSRRDAVAYATGARSLWTAGTRPFGAGCVLVGAGRSVHLLSTWDEGVPPEVPVEHLYGITWNPEIMARSLAAIPGLAGARRIGVDGLSPGFARAARRLAARAEVVPADDLLRAVRATKLPAEVERIRAAVAVAAAGVEAAAAALASGAPRVEALAAAWTAVAAHGTTVPASAPVVEPLAAGSLAHVDLGFLVDEYEGGRGRTVPVGPGAEARLDAARIAQRRLLEACHPGAEGRSVQAAAAAAGATGFTVRGSGMGFEHPVVTRDVGGSVVLSAGMVLSVEVDLDGVRRRDLAVVGPDAAQPVASAHAAG